MKYIKEYNRFKDWEINENENKQINLLIKYNENKISKDKFIYLFNNYLIESINISNKIISSIKWIINNIIKITINKLITIINTIFNFVKKHLPSKLTVVGFFLLLILLIPINNKIYGNTDNKDKNKTEISLNNNKKLLNVSIGLCKIIIEDEDDSNVEKKLYDVMSILVEIRDGGMSIDTASDDYKYVKKDIKKIVKFFINETEGIISKSLSTKDNYDDDKFILDLFDIGKNIIGYYNNQYGYNISSYVNDTTDDFIMHHTFRIW